MFKQISITAIICLVCLSGAMLPVNAQAEGSQTTGSESSQSKGGPVRQLHKKIRNMRPRIKMRKAAAKAVTGGNKKTSAAPTTGSSK